MKECRHCGSKNATRAQFCSQCGGAFRVSESVSESVDLEKRPSSAIERVERPRDEDEKLGAATRTFLKVLFAHLVGIAFAFARWFWRLTRPLARATFEFLRARVVYMFSSASRWDRTRSPNFVYVGILSALLWRLPTSVVALVYAALANDARRRGEFDLARDRAELAKNWLIVDFVVGVVVCVFRNLVLS